MLVSLSLLLSVTLPLVAAIRSGRISNGGAAVPSDFPSAVGLLISGASSHQFCGGVLISTRFILTSARCVSGFVVLRSREVFYYTYTYFIFLQEKHHHSSDRRKRYDRDR